MGSPRMPLPPETNTVNYDENYLPYWAMPPALWNALPQWLHEHITYLQEAGAAVMTGLNRLDALKKTAGGKVVESDDEDDSSPTIPDVSPMIDHSFTPQMDPLETPRTPSLTSHPSGTGTPFSSRSNSIERMSESEGHFVRGIHITTGEVSSHGTLITPFELGPAMALIPVEKLSKSITRRVSELTQPIPQDLTHPSQFRRATESALTPRSAPSSSDNWVPPARTSIVQRWRAELSYLRETTLPRLRHGLRRVNAQWRVYTSNEEANAKRHHENPHLREAPGYREPLIVAEPASWQMLEDEMGGWLESMRRRVKDIEARDEKLEGGVVLGWGTRERGSPQSLRCE
jgi:hypothetical protein